MYSKSQQQKKQKNVLTKLAPFPSVSVAELEQLNAGCGDG